jgi:hypothetical protein
MKMLIRAVVAAVAVISLSGCAGMFTTIPQDCLAANSGDRCYIEDYQFVMADQLYSKFGSLALVERHLYEINQWRDCEINEAIYRLRKVHGLP